MANTKVQSEQIADDAVVTSHIADNVGLGGSPTTTTQSPSDNSTKIATTAYVDAAYAALVDSSPATLNTLNELAAALGDDANFSTTVTNSIATKVALSGSGQTIADSGNLTLDVAGDIILDAAGGDVSLKNAGNEAGKIVIGDATDSNITLDVAGDIILDADGGDVIFRDGGTSYITATHSSGDVVLTSNVDDKDIIFKGYDSGSLITALTLDMSNAGAATFNAGGEFGGDVNIFGANRLINIGESGSGGTYGFLGWNDASNYLYLGNTYNSAYNTDIVINSSGKVGIGTDSPSTKLHLGGTAPLDSIIRQDSTSSGTNWEIGERAAGKWQIFEDDSDSIVATFKSDGKVGIGNESPNAKLDVVATSGEIFRADANNGAYRLVANQTGVMMNGNVGIGTGSPDNKLHIYAGDSGHTWSYDSGDYFIIENSDSVAMNMASPSSNQNLILFSDNAARGIGLIGYNHNEDTLRFHANGEQRLKLDGASSGEAAMKITQSSETAGQLLIRSNYSDPHYLATQGTNSSSGGWYWGYGVQMSGSGTTKSTFSNFSGARSFVQLLGDKIQYKFAGAQNTAIGSAVSGLTESVRIDAQGIKFNGDTGTANALDDYEEGTWSPTIIRNDGSTAATFTASAAYSRYTKIGRFVFLQAYFSGVSDGSSNGSSYWRINGVPFAGNAYTGNMLGYNNLNTASGAYIGDAGGNIILTNGASAYTGTLGSNRQFMLMFTYETNA